MGATKVFFLALDGADPDLLQHWMAAGSLPHLARLKAGSRSAEVGAPRGFGSDAIWPSVYTGVDPSRHGRYYHQQEEQGSYLSGARRRLDLQCPAVWEAVAGSGGRVVIADLPKAPGPSLQQGVTILDWMTHYSQREFRTWPPQLADAIRRRYGDTRDCPCLASRYEDQAPAAALSMVAPLAASIAHSRALILDLLAEQPWDLFMTSIGALHCAGHQLWHLHDAAHPWHRAAGELAADPLHALYRQADAAVGDILSSLPAGCAVGFLGGPGMAGSYIRRELLDDILQRLDQRPGSRARGVGGRLKSLWYQFPVSLRRPLSGLAHRLDRRLRARDRAGRQFYPLWTNDSVGGIRINLRGREPDGLVAPEELDATCDRLVDALAGLRMAGTGEPVVLDVFPTRAVYRGAHLDELPDVLIVWNQQPVTAIESPLVGTIRQDRLPDWSGTHTGRSLFMLRTPDGGGGDLPAQTSLLDIAPTLAALCGGALPGADGRSLLPAMRAAGASSAG